MALAGCDLLGGEEPDQRRAEATLQFSVRSEPPLQGGWIYWYVQDGTLYRLTAGPDNGPYVAQVDCATHAGLSLQIRGETDDPDQVTARIVSVDEDPEEDVIAEETYATTGEHHLLVRVACD